MDKSGNLRRIHRKKRITKKIKSASRFPRMCVFRSNRSLYAQIIEDSSGKTIVAARLAEIKKAKNDTKGAMELGKLIAKKCKEAGIVRVVFDRSGYKYHGKIKSLAEGAIEGGLKF